MKYWVSVGGRELEVEIDGDAVTVAGTGTGGRASLDVIPGTPLYALTRDGTRSMVTCEALGRGQWSIGMQGTTFEVEVLDPRTRHIRSLAGPTAAMAGGGVLRAPMPGLVVRVQAEPGQQVAAGAPLVVLEAMKMENQLKAPAAGVVGEVKVAAGAAVEKGQVLVTLSAER